MSKKTPLLQDPSIKTNMAPTYTGYVLMLLFIVVAFVGNVKWMIMMYTLFLYITFALSIIILSIIMKTKGKTDITKITTSSRIPNWWLYATGIVTSTLLWLITPTNELVIIYFISKVILSINYNILINSIDRRYTKKVLNKPGSLIQNAKRESK